LTGPLATGNDQEEDEDVDEDYDRCEIAGHSKTNVLEELRAKQGSNDLSKTVHGAVDAT